MRFRRRLGFIAVVAFIGTLIAIHQAEDPAQPESAFDTTPQPQVVGPAQDNRNSVAVGIAENAIDGEILRGEDLGAVDSLANAESDDQATQEPFARVEPNDVSPDQGVESRNRFAENLEQEFANESRDPVWSSQMEYRILEQISQLPGIEANLIEVDCRLTQCRIQLTLPATIPPEQLVTASDNGLRVSVADELGLAIRRVFMSASSPGVSVFVAYLRRPGSSRAQPFRLRRNASDVPLVGRRGAAL
jgi:hypothetical protein